MRALVKIADPTATIYDVARYDEAVALCDSKPLDLAFLDFDLKSDQTGLDVLRYLREKNQATKVIMLSAHGRRDLVVECIEAGASGFIPKQLDDNESVFRRALDTVFDGGIFLPSSVLGRGSDSTVQPADPPKVTAESLGIRGRALEVLYYLCQGLPNKTIATRMGISENTVRKDYATQLFRIFNVARRTQLIIEVARRGITVPTPLNRNS